MSGASDTNELSHDLAEKQLAALSALVTHVSVVKGLGLALLRRQRAAISALVVPVGPVRIQGLAVVCSQRPGKDGKVRES